MAKATCSDLILFFFKSWKCQHLPYIFSVMLGAEKNLQAWWPFQKLCRPLQSFFSTGSIHKAPDISYVAGFKDLARQYRTLYLQMFCSLFPPGPEECQHHGISSLGLSATWFLLFPELLLIYLLQVLPNPGTCTTVFLDTDTIHSDVSEHIKGRNGFHPQLIIISQWGSAWWFINREELEEDGIISPRSEYKPKSLISVQLVNISSYLLEWNLSKWFLSAHTPMHF